MSVTEAIETHENAQQMRLGHQFFRDLYGLVLHPGAFYEELPRTRRFSSALIFLFSCSLISGTLANLHTGQKNMIVLTLIYFLNAVSMPFITAIVLYVVAMFSCRNAFTFKTLFSITAYANVVLLVAWIPGVAWLAGIWRFYLLGLGMVRAGRISALKALVSVVVTLVVLLLALRFFQPMLSIS